MNGWLLHHRQAAAQAFRRLSATPLNTLLGALVLGIALALPAGGEMLLANFQRLAQRYDPAGKFRNAFLERYLLPVLSDI